MSAADELVGGLLVRYLPVQCLCGRCEEPADVVVVAVPGEDRWVAVSASVPEAWPATRDLREGADADWFDVASRLVAMFGMPWGLLDVRVQVASVLGLMRSPVLLATALSMSPEECRLMADGSDVRVRAQTQAATS